VSLSVEDEQICTQSFEQAWNDLGDYYVRSGYGEHEQIEQLLEESVDASSDPSASNVQLQAITTNAPVDGML